MSHLSATAVPRSAASLRRRLPWLILLFGMLLVWATASQASAPATPRVSVTSAQVSVSPEPGHLQAPLYMAAISGESGTEQSRSNRHRLATLPASPAESACIAPRHVFLFAASNTLLLHAVERAQRYPLAPYLLLNPGHAPPLA